jgi:hypothetical protein
MVFYFYGFLIYMVFIWCSGFYRFLWAYHFKDFYSLGGFYVFLWVYHFKDFYSLGGILCIFMGLSF